MFIDNYFVVPGAVSHLKSVGDKGSKGCHIVMKNGHVIKTLFPMTQVVAGLALDTLGTLK